MTTRESPPNPLPRTRRRAGFGLLGLVLNAVLAAPAAAQPAVGTVTANGWRVCAAEGQTCQVNGRAIVRYGVDGRWARRVVNGSVSCGNEAFGDPAPQTPKVCEVRDYGAGAGNAGSAGSAGSADGWTFCAAEGEVCRLRGTAQVRFGDGNRYTTRTAYGQVRCAVEDFGDPAYGVTKHCEVRSTAALPGSGDRPVWGGQPAAANNWRYCATEGETCRVNGQAQVRFGDGRRYVTRRVRGEVTCDIATFGDPAPNVVKHCEVVGNGWTGSGGGNGATAANWSRCAGEGQRCEFNGQAQVRYGSAGRYTYREAYNGMDCVSGAFGIDPYPNRVKSCEIRR